MSKLGVGGPGDGAPGKGAQLHDDGATDDAEVMPQFRDVLLDIDPADPMFSLARRRRHRVAFTPCLVRDELVR